MFKLFNLFRSFRRIRHVALPPPAGVYRIEFTLPPASHMGVYEEDLFLTSEEAAEFSAACHAEMVFTSTYSDHKWVSVADKLALKLKAAHPQFVWPVGVILSCTLLPNTEVEPARPAERTR